MRKSLYIYTILSTLLLPNHAFASSWVRVKSILPMRMHLADKLPEILPEFAAIYLILAGFIIGLGAVTVIDSLGFMGRKSPYWTDVTIKAHKVTKPLIWLGLSFIFLGNIIHDKLIYPHTEVTYYIYIVFSVLVLNGAFLSFYISPKLIQLENENKSKELLPSSLQSKIMVSFIISFIGWWLSLFLILWKITITNPLT